MGILSWLTTVVDRLVPVLLAVAIVGFVVLAWRLLRQPAGHAVDETLRDLALAAAAAVVLAFTLFTASRFGGEGQVRLVPFVDLVAALAGRGSLRVVLAEAVGNLLLFIPLGLALRWRFPALGLVGVTGVGLASSIAIEVLQGVLAGGRWTDSTDVIMNTLGGAIGALAAGIGLTRASGGRTARR